LEININRGPDLPEDVWPVDGPDADPAVPPGGLLSPQPAKLKANKKNTLDLNRPVAKEFTGLPPQAVFSEIRTMAPIITDRNFRRNVSIAVRIP
jgi:hypothetical protein